MWRVSRIVTRRTCQPMFGGLRQNIRALSSGPHPNESFLSGANAVYLDQMYEVYKANPENVDPSLRVYFKNVDAGLDPGAAFQPFPGLATPMSSAPTSGVSGTGSIKNQDSINLVHLVRAYQTRGHLCAKLDPLGLQEVPEIPDLDYHRYGFKDSDLDRSFDISAIADIAGVLNSKEPVKLKDVLDTLKSAYCNRIGVEYMHIIDREQCNFIRERFEIPNAVKNGLSLDDRKLLLERTGFAVLWEQFLQLKWNTAKRFGLEGCESFIPGFKSLIDESTMLGVEHVVVGMPHRGRLNTIANVVRKDLFKIFAQFRGLNVESGKVFSHLQNEYALSGDVKYHLGMTYKRMYPDGRAVELSLAANPSHLEAVNPVVIGKTRAKQFYDNDTAKGRKSMAVLVHGDAAVSGQGIVYETIGMSKLSDYSTHGVIHIVVNNQIGFTTDPHCSRSTRYCTDLGKAFDCPIFHVNADDPEAVHYVFKVAAQYRHRFNSDVFIDLIGYRKHGHNEMDQPMFTQPAMYEKIKKTPNVFDIYSKQLVEQGIVEPSYPKEVTDKVMAIYEEQYEKSTKPEYLNQDNDHEWIDQKWTGQHAIGHFSKRQPTRVDEDVLKNIGEVIFQPPSDFHAHRTIKKILSDKLEMVRSGKRLDWGCAELLAYGSLLLEGKHVRVSGQDCQRGTFSHRHAVLHNQKAPFDTWCGLNQLQEKVKPISGNSVSTASVCNSSLSEFGIMGFELGYSLEDPNALIIWEAQFGDFSNGAQIMIDQFLSCGETKWNRQCGLTLFLPHGYDGQGPEHSSCRIERFLQLSDEDPDEIPEHSGKEQSMAIQNNNWQVVNCTTPAQIFHVLRRQVHRGFRKPLVVATPKSMLKDDLVRSDIEDLTGEHAYFHRVLMEVDPEVNATPDDKIRKVIFCTGKIYYDLATQRRADKKFDIAIIRIEQITPFPFDRIQEVYKKYPNAELVFAQEEPKNMGTWYFCDDRIYTSIRQVKVERGDDVDNEPELRCKFVGRPTMASPAVGYGSVHNLEQQHIIKTALE